MEDQGETEGRTYLVGIGVTHSIAPIMHNYVAESLGFNWTFTAQECPSIDDVLRLFRARDFAGGVVTMPYKIAILQYLDGLDTTAQLIGACNNVYVSENGQLRGTNTDWRGVEGCLESETVTASGTGKGNAVSEIGRGRDKSALLIGAGGAARAAIYALHRELGCKPIYVANRDRHEVETLIRDTRVYGEDCEIVHVDSEQQAREVMGTRGFPFYIVGTVPDFEPQSASEIAVSDVLRYCLISAPEKGVLLDMCFKPRRTRTIVLAEKYGWPTVEGIDVIGHQIEEQYRLWNGNQTDTPITPAIQDGAWKVLRTAADDSKMIN